MFFTGRLGLYVCMVTQHTRQKLAYQHYLSWTVALSEQTQRELVRRGGLSGQ